MLKFPSFGGLLPFLCCSLAFSQSPERLSLKEAVEIALQNNPAVAGARRGVDASRARFWRGVSPPPPILSTSYDYIPTGGGLNEYGERAIGISQSFDFPTTIALRGSSLSSEADAAEADLQTTSLSVTMQVKEAYYRVLANQQKLKLAEENLAIADDFAHKAGIRYNVGEGTNLENLTAKVQRTQAQNAVEVARNDLHLATGELSYALGRGMEQPFQGYELTDSLSHRSYMLTLDSMLEQAGRQNPQIRSDSFRVQAASINRAIAWSSLLPSFSLSYSRQVQGPVNNLYGVAFGISLPIWFLFDQRGQVQEAAAAHAIAESEYRARGNFVNLDVRNAFLEFRNDERQVQVYLSDLLPQADEVYRAAAASYEAGEITYIEFLQARQTLISARSGYIDALFHYNTAIARLERAIGGPVNQ